MDLNIFSNFDLKIDTKGLCYFIKDYYKNLF